MAVKDNDKSKSNEIEENEGNNGNDLKEE